MKRRILAYFFSSLVFVTNISLPVFTHICHSQSKSWSSVYFPAKSCCSGIKSKNRTGCRKVKIADPYQVGKTPCCENQQELIVSGIQCLQVLKETKQSPSDHFMEIFNQVRTFQLPCFFKAFQSIKIKSPPYYRYGRSLLGFLQVIRC